MRKDQPSKAHLIMSRQLEATNNSAITQSVIEPNYFTAILWPGITPSCIDKKFLLLLTDGINYTRKAGKNLKAIYPKLPHVTCLAHGINRVAEDVRRYFPEVDKLVGNIKAVFRKSPSRVTKFKEMFPALTLPRKPVLTRWGTWLDAVEYYAENFDSIQTVLNFLDSSKAKSIEISKEILAEVYVRRDLALISTNFTFLSSTLKKLQNSSSRISETLGIIDEVKRKLSIATGTVASEVINKFENVLEKNSDLKKIISISRALNGEAENIIGILKNFDPARISSFKFATLTSVVAERSFSIRKALLPDNRRCLTVPNLEMEIVSHFELGLD